MAGPGRDAEPRVVARRSAPWILLRIEGAILLTIATAWYVGSGGTWWFFLLLLLVPDLSMLGYVRGPRIGAIVYDLFHAYPLPGLLMGLAYLAGTPLALHLALVWLAHIGMDRMLGYGLKYASGFGDTHLQRV